MTIKNKILDIKNLKKIRSKFIGKKIVLCHGVFDLLHVGHINYFKSSKVYGDILVVSVTNDKFVNKGPGRPAFSINNRLKFLFCSKKNIFGCNFVNFDLKYCRLLLIQALPGCIGNPIVTHHLSAKVYAHSGAPRTPQLHPKHVSFRAENFSLSINIIVNNVFSAGNDVGMGF